MATKKSGARQVHHDTIEKPLAATAGRPRGWRIRPRPAKVSDLTEDERWLLRFDRRARAFAADVHPVVWRSTLARRLEHDGAWADDAPLTRDAVLALTLRVQEWLVDEPSALPRARGVLNELRRLVQGADIPRNEILHVLEAAMEEEPEDRLRFVRLNLRRLVGEKAPSVSDEVIGAALAGWSKPKDGEASHPRWKPVVDLLKAAGINDVSVTTIPRRWRAFVRKRKRGTPAP